MPPMFESGDHQPTNGYHNGRPSLGQTSRFTFDSPSNLLPDRISELILALALRSRRLNCFSPKLAYPCLLTAIGVERCLGKVVGNDLNIAGAMNYAPEAVK